jgi:hypothetical protein
MDYSLMPRTNDLPNPSNAPFGGHTLGGTCSYTVLKLYKIFIVCLLYAQLQLLTW